MGTLILGAAAISIVGYIAWQVTPQDQRNKILSRIKQGGQNPTDRHQG